MMNVPLNHIFVDCIMVNFAFDRSGSTEAWWMVYLSREFCPVNFVIDSDPN